MASEEKYTISKWMFTPARNELDDGQSTHRLEDRASRVLEFLCRNSGEVVSKEELIEHVWQGRHLSEQSVPVVISNLRKIFTEGGEKSEIIETIPKRGYRVISARPTQSVSRPGWQRLVGIAAGLVAVFLLGFYFLQGEPTKARKPGIILTLNDIRNATGDEARMNQVIALSEAGSHFLSQAGGILLIRHWWNIEADDPTGGIFERYGEDAPIYHVSGTLIEEAGRLSVTLFLSNPKTDEVLWSEAYPIGDENFIAPHLDGLGKILAVLGLEEQISPTGEANLTQKTVAYYWLGLYFWHLGTEDTAPIAHDMWQKALGETPGLAAARLGIKALSARWPNLFPGEGDVTVAEIPDSDASVLVQAGTIALYGEEDPAKARDLAQKALILSPNDFSAYALLAETLVLEGKIEEGLKAIKEARLLAPFSTVYPEREAEFTEILESGGD